MAIKVFRAADKDMLRALARAGVCTQSHFRSFGNSKGLSQNRMNQHIKDGLVAKDCYYDKSMDRYADCYVLTKQGMSLAKDRLGINSIYHSNSRVHDLALMDKYTSLDREEQQSWRTEPDLRQEAHDRFNALERQRLEERQMSPPDAVYTSSEGRVIAYEIVTDNYGRAEIRAKEEFAEALNIELQTQKI